MSLCRLSTGKFLALGAVDVFALWDGALKEEIDRLTHGGRNIEAVLATHPFHILGFPHFYAAYPTPKYVGCFFSPVLRCYVQHQLTVSAEPARCSRPRVILIFYSRAAPS